MGSVQRAKFKGIITITGVAELLYDVGVFDLHARDASECQKSLSEKWPLRLLSLDDFYAWAACNGQNSKE